MASNASGVLSEAAERYPDSIALSQAGAALTWSALNSRVTAFARGALSRGLRAGDRVAIVTSNRVEFVVAHFGAMRAGLVSAPLNSALTAHELAQRTHALSTALVICDAASEVAVREALVTNRLGTEGVVAVASPAWGDLMRPDHSDREPVVTDPESIAALLFTAGTAAGAQTAMLSHRALLAAGEQMATLDPAPVHEGDVLLLAMPLTAAHVLNGLIPAAARSGAAVVIERRFDPVECFEAMEREAATVVAGPPAMFAEWVSRPEAAEALRDRRLLSLGAAPVPTVVSAQLTTISGNAIWQGYGVVEAASLLTCTGGRSSSSDSVGRPLPGVEVVLRDVDGDEVDGDPGAVLVRGANLFSGFWPDGGGGPDPEGWYDTSDVAYRDDDGDLHLVDRRHDLIVVNGFPVYPREVETVIMDLPGVAEAAIVGIDHPVSGQAVRAFVVAQVGESIASDDVLAHCSQRLARFKCPTIVEIVDELPHDPSGAVLRRDLRSAGDRAR